MMSDNLPKINYIILGIIICSFIVGVLVYGALPERVPMHWNLKGEVDRYGGKLTGAFGIPVMTLAIYVLMVFLPRIDPKRKSYSKFLKSYNIVAVGIVFFMLLLYVITLLAAFEYPVDVGTVVRLGLGILFIIIGNYLTQVRHNYFFGIKNPWTLASERVWKKTHRVGGILFVIAGIFIILSILLGSKVGYIITIGSVFLVLIITTVYSYVLYSKEFK